MFGSLCYAYNIRRHGDKFESRSRRCAFAGYPNGQKGWRLFDLETNEFFVSRDVVFSKTEFLFLTLKLSVANEEEEPELWAPILNGPIKEEERNLSSGPSTQTGPNEEIAQEIVQSTTVPATESTSVPTIPESSSELD